MHHRHISRGRHDFILARTKSAVFHGIFALNFNIAGYDFYVFLERMRRMYML